MHIELEKLVASLEPLIDGLYYSLVGDEPYEMVTWEAKTQGEFSLENCLKDIRGLVSVATEGLLKAVE